MSIEKAFRGSGRSFRRVAISATLLLLLGCDGGSHFGSPRLLFAAAFAFPNPYCYYVYYPRRRICESSSVRSQPHDALQRTQYLFASRTRYDEQSTTDDSSPRRNVVSQTFWYTTTVEKNDDDDEKIIVAKGSTKQKPQYEKVKRLPPLPRVPKLDSEGLLPPGAYFQTADDAKDTCRLQVAWDLTDLKKGIEVTRDDIDEMVRTMQTFIDSGLTSFQLKAHDRDWAETNVYGALMEDTPKTVLRHCHLTVPLRLSDVMDTAKVGSRVTAVTVRSAIVDHLSRMGGDDCIDNVQIRFPNRPVTSKQTNSYYLDLLDGLQELRREGLVRDVSSRCTVSEQFLSMADQAGFGKMITTNQVEANLLDSLGLQETGPSLLQVPRPRTIVSSPLAGGWLTGRFAEIDPSRPPTPSWLKKLSFQERRQWKQVERWCSKHCPGGGGDFHSLWEIYHSKLLLALRGIARKHGVSIASVVLRWTLQLENVASTIVSCRLLPGRHYWDARASDNKRRAQQLRQVFSFELDEEDMELLWELSGRVERNEPGLDLNIGDWLERNEQMSKTATGL